MISVYAWLRRHPLLVDAVLACALAATGIGSIVRAGRFWESLPFTFVMVIAVVLRRRYPTGAFAAAVTAGAAQLVAGVRPSGPNLAIVILLYTLAAYRPRRVSVPGLVICLIGAAAAVATWSRPKVLSTPTALLAESVVLMGPVLIGWVLGDSMRYRRAYYASLEDRAARLERERDAQAQIATAAERARIARELHDVVAHNVSVMVVQADGASYALDTEPERARQALAAISRTGRQALNEMRRLLGVLRSDEQAGQPTGLAPMPGVDELGELIDQARAAGLPVSCTVSGTPRPLPGGVALAAYRVVQEALTNTRKHGGPTAAAAVTLTYGDDTLSVRIVDDGCGAAAVGDGRGHGLIGMRERVEMYGGDLLAGPRRGGGYQVTAMLPVGSPAHADEAGSAVPRPGGKDGRSARTPARKGVA
ncbi:MAG TPA: sensor histidine kinase [Streptosporangiaceae bacterium]|nr:sensor histidine kinase [Streptosporangiaceae bacterium]